MFSDGSPANIYDLLGVCLLFGGKRLGLVRFSFSFCTSGLDTMHLPMTLEYGSSRRRTAGSKVLRAIMQKFSAVSHAHRSFLNSKPFAGVFPPALTYQEESRRQQILNGTMLKHKAEGILSNLDVSRPWSSRLEFIEALAALAKVHRDEMLRKIPGPNRSGCSILHSACSASRAE